MAVDAKSGFMLHDLAEAEFSRAIMSCARTRIVAADSTKFGKRAPIVVGNPADIDVLVCDAEPPPELAAALAGWAVEIVTAA